MAKRNDITIAFLVQGMDELGFNQETIPRVTGVPLRTISVVKNRRQLSDTTQHLFARHVARDN